MHSWIDISPTSDFSMYNFPFGVYKTAEGKYHAASAIGNYIIDLYVLAEANVFHGVLNLDKTTLAQSTLNSFIAQGKAITNAVRTVLQDVFGADNATLRDNAELRSKALLKQGEVQMVLPIHIPNYTDFYSSREHATNVGIMFRDPANALLPNWLHLPVGYHGRASSIVVSGTDIHRPKGQTKADDADKPSFGPCRLLDFELEMAFVVGKETKLGESVSTAHAEEHIFGMMLFNDWSARDIQKWEYVPLGPFLAKNFGSTVSPWIVTIEALAPFKVDGPVQEPEVLPYLKYEGHKNYDINLQVDIVPENSQGKTVCQSNFKHMYWNMSQQLAHHTVNGCNIQVGDMYASGTISGPTPDSFGSMLEISWQGKKPVAMPDGSERRFIQDGDTVVITGHADKAGIRVGFGECKGKILPAI